MNDERQKIKIRIGTWDHLLKVSSPEEENYFRRAAKEINAKLISYQTEYPGNPSIEFLSFIALLMAKKVLMLEDRIKNDPLKEEIDDLDARLRQYLQKDNE